MYALKRLVKKKHTLPLGETLMKKVLLALLLGIAGYASAATPTNSVTPSSTVTVTSTITPTFTLTPTRTNVPSSGFGSGTGRVIVQAPQFLLADGVTRPVTTPVPGSADIWLAQALSYTAAVFSTGTASARVQITVPADYQRNGNLWLYAYNSSLTNTVTIEADVSKVSFGALTSTSTVLVGPATNVQTEFVGYLAPATYSRVWVPLSATVQSNYTKLKPGDLLNILVIRSGASGNLNVFAAEFEYAVNYPLRP